MSEVIKAQAQKVLEARQAKNALMESLKPLIVGTEEWSEAVDKLIAVVEMMHRDEALLCSLVIEEQLGVFSV